MSPPITTAVKRPGERKSQSAHDIDCRLSEVVAAYPLPCFFLRRSSALGHRNCRCDRSALWGRDTEALGAHASRVPVG